MPKSYRIIPLGVDVDHFRPDPAAGAEVWRELGWDQPGPPVVGFLGRFVEQKGVMLLTRVLDSLRRLARAGGRPWAARAEGAGVGRAAMGHAACRHGSYSR